MGLRRCTHKMNCTDHQWSWFYTTTRPYITTLNIITFFNCGEMSLLANIISLASIYLQTVSFLDKFCNLFILFCVLRERKSVFFLLTFFFFDPKRKMTLLFCDNQKTLLFLKISPNINKCVPFRQSSVKPFWSIIIFQHIYIMTYPILIRTLPD